MSRCGEYDDWDPNFPNEDAFWRANAERALKGKRGRKALADLREALMALPERRLIANAFSTVAVETVDTSAPVPKWGEPGFDFTTYRTHQDAQERNTLLAEQGHGVCSVAAYVWHQKVKAGADPQEALKELPLLPDYDGDGSWHTEQQGVAAGLTKYVAWTLMQRNDDHLDHLTPEGRWQAVVDWIDEQLGQAVDA